MTPKERDRFLGQWQQPELLLQHLTSMANYGAADLAIVWARVGVLLVAVLGEFGGCVWLISHTQPSAGARRWVVFVPLMGALICAVLCILRLIAAASPMHQSEPHRLARLKEAWDQSRDQIEGADATGERLRIVEKVLILANWADVADDFVVANKRRLEHARSATRLFFCSFAFLAASGLLWGMLQAIGPPDPESEVTSVPDDEREPPIAHPPTEVTERTNPPPSETSLVHPPTEVTEKGYPRQR